MKLALRGHTHLTCPLCRDELGTATVCPGCATGYHAACVDELGGRCSTLGCELSLVTHERTFPTVAEHRERLRREGLLHGDRVTVRAVEVWPRCTRCTLAITATPYACPRCGCTLDANCFVSLLNDGCPNAECSLIGGTASERPLPRHATRAAPAEEGSVPWLLYVVLTAFVVGALATKVDDLFAIRNHLGVAVALSLGLASVVIAAIVLALRSDEEER